MTHCQFCGAQLQPSLPYCQSCGAPLSSNNTQGRQATSNSGHAPQQPPIVMPTPAMPQGNHPPAPSQSLQPRVPSTLFKKPGLAISQPSSLAQRGTSLSGQPSQSGLQGFKPASQSPSLSGFQNGNFSAPPQPPATPPALAGFQGGNAQQPQPPSWSGMPVQHTPIPAQQQAAHRWGAPIATPAPAPFPLQPQVSTPANLPQSNGMPGAAFTPLPNTPQPPAAEAQPPMWRKSRALLSVWLTIFILCAVVVAAVGVIAYQKYSGNPAQQASSSFVSVQGPSGASSVESAATIILNTQTSSRIDINYNPVDPRKSFAVGQKIYISFDIQAKTKTGYIKVKWYNGKKVKDTDTFAHDPTNSSGYFSTHYDSPTRGAAELYWCTRANCSDAQLAQVVTFTVTP